MARRRQEEGPPPHVPLPGEQRDLTFEKGLPCSLETERLVLGMILLNDEYFDQVNAKLPTEAFHLEKHRRIYSAMKDMSDKGEIRIDRVTLADELIKRGQLESVDGLAYLVSLDDGLPEIANLDSYLLIIQEKYALRRAIFQAQAVIDRCLLAQDDAGVILSSAEPEFREIAAWNEKDTGGRSAAQIIENYPGGISAFMDPFNRPKGLPYGFKRLDELTTGMHAGELIVVAARPRVGKSAISMNIASHIAGAFDPEMEGKKVHYFSLEMSAESLLTRMMCSVGRVNQHKFRSGFLNEDDRYKLQKALYQITESKIILDDKFKKTMSQMERRIKQAVKEDCVLVVIDQLSLMTTDRKDANRQAVVSDITRNMKILLGECGIPGILINQISRAADNRQGTGGRPQLEDLKQSGSLEEDSDTVLLVYREELYKRDRTDLKGKAEVIIAKQRNGMESTVKLRWLGQYSRFVDAPEDDGGDQSDAQRTFGDD